MPHIVNFPKTTTLLALGFLLGNFAMTPMLAWLGKNVPPEYTEVVLDVGKTWRDGMMLIIGYYFAKVSMAEMSEQTTRQLELAETKERNRGTIDPTVGTSIGYRPLDDRRPVEPEWPFDSTGRAATPGVGQEGKR